MGNKQAVSTVPSEQEEVDPFTKDVRELFYVDERLKRISNRPQRRLLSEQDA